jgi:hypothetical protein
MYVVAASQTHDIGSFSSSFRSRLFGFTLDTFTFLFSFLLSLL